MRQRDIETLAALRAGHWPCRNFYLSQCLTSPPASLGSHVSCQRAGSHIASGGPSARRENGCFLTSDVRHATGAADVRHSTGASRKVVMSPRTSPVACRVSSHRPGGPRSRAAAARRAAFPVRAASPRWPQRGVAALVYALNLKNFFTSPLARPAEIC